MKKIFVTIMTLAVAIFQMQAIEDASISIQLESDNNRTSVVTLNQAAIYTANEQNASEMLAQITNTKLISMPLLLMETWLSMERTT